MDKLKEIYYNPKTGFISSKKLYARLKGELSLKQIKDFLQKQETHQINKAPKPPKYRHYRGGWQRNKFQADLMIMDKYKASNKQYKYVLLVIDVFSRYLFAEPLKTKNKTIVLQALKKILKRSKLPNALYMDEGAEFMTQPLIKYCNDNNIYVKFFDPKQPHKNAIVERVIATIRNMIKRYRTAYKSFNWINVIQDIIDNYNNSVHSTLKYTPSQVWNREVVYKEPIDEPEDDIPIGTRIRIKKQLRQVFDKPTDVKRYTKGIYTIHEVKQHQYYVKNSRNDVLKRPYQRHQLEIIEKVETFTPPTSNIKKEKKQIRKRKIADKMKQEGLSYSNITKSKRQSKPNKRYL